jgi:hypothetical protein
VAQCEKGSAATLRSSGTFRMSYSESWRRPTLLPGDSNCIVYLLFSEMVSILVIPFNLTVCLDFLGEKRSSNLL